jgi:hypothetical protein
MAYKLKIVLGKRQYRRGPTEKAMKSKLKIKKPTARMKRIRQIGRRLGS